jgi:hypothetical protein
MEIHDGDLIWRPKMKISSKTKISSQMEISWKCISTRWIETRRVRELYHHRVVEYSILLEVQKFFSGEV